MIKYAAFWLIFMSISCILYKFCISINAVDFFWLIIIGFTILSINNYFEKR